MGNFEIAVSFLLVIVLLFAGLSLYIVYQELPGEPRELVLKKAPNEQNLPGIIDLSKLQFYPNMRFSKMPVSYWISSECSNTKETDTKDAMAIISSKTGGLVSFLQKADEKTADIAVTCSKTRTQIEEDYYIAGEGGPTEVYNVTDYAVIVHGEITLIEDSQCPNPNVAIHELLHVFGFDHVENRSSIMYKTSYCNQQIDAEIVNELMRLYLIKSMPNLVLKVINATAKGPYLDFSLSILNKGLVDSEATDLSIYADNKFAQKIEIEPLKIGQGIFLSMENLKMTKRNAQEIKFLVDSTNSIEELDEADNMIIFRSTEES